MSTIGDNTSIRQGLKNIYPEQWLNVTEIKGERDGEQKKRGGGEAGAQEEEWMAMKRKKPV